MRKKSLILILFIILKCQVQAQNNNTVNIHFSGLFNGSKIIFNDYYALFSKTDSIQFTSIKFYISNLELLKNTRSVYTEPNSFHLIDLCFDSTSFISLPIPENISYDELKFHIGIDSLTNVSGAMGGDLDPTKGMYWTWQNGYINAKIEGKSNLCKTRHNEFEFHIGGYTYPFNSLQTKRLLVKNKNDINLILEMEKLFQEINLSTQNKLMSPSSEVVKLAILFSTTFTLAK